MHFETLDNISLQQLLNEGHVLEQDGHGPKVVHLASGEFLKIFRRKRLLSSALFTPYSVRFYRNAERLKSLSIPTLTPTHLYRLEKPGLTAVSYIPLDGDTLRSHFPKATAQEKEDLLKKLASFINQLHEKGIYFRSLHLGNIILTPGGALGLIDISDMSFTRKPLSKSKAKRNLKHFTSHLERENIDFPQACLMELLSKPD